MNDMDKIDDHIIFKAITGKASPEDEKLIESHYERNPEECRKAFNDLHAINDLSELDLIEKKLRRHKKTALLKKTAAWISAAAAAIVFAVLSGYISRQITISSFSEMLTTVEAPPGEIIRIILPDSTSVFLNSGARLRYPAVFHKDRRNVFLAGEAMFDVSNDGKRPFIVNTFASEIEVLGTRFNVSAAEEDGDFSATLIEGKIILTNLLDGRRSRIAMQPNDIVRITDGRLEITRVDDPDICWTRGLVKIDGKNFTELMNDFEKSFNINIEVKMNSIPDMKGAGGKIRISDGIDNAMKILQHTTQFEFTRDDDTNTITIY